MDSSGADLFDELSHLALGSRLKRLSERLMGDVSKVYKEYGQDLEPSTFPILACLDRFPSIGIVEMAQQIGFSQPAVSRAVKDLQQRKLLKLTGDRSDLRRKKVELSAEGKRTVARLKEGLWPAVRKAAVDLCRSEGDDFLEHLKAMERRLDESPISERARRLAQTAPEVEILPFHDGLATHFDTINREWIQDMFTLEAADEHILRNPKDYVMDRGGSILFAKAGDLGVVGTGALLKTAEGRFELTKMGVLRKARGLKVGEKLLQALIDEAKARKAELLYLLTNTDCAAAIHLYEKNGFVHDADIMENYGKKYQRCNVAMRYAGL